MFGNLNYLAASNESNTSFITSQDIVHTTTEKFEYGDLSLGLGVPSTLARHETEFFETLLKMAQN